MVVVARLIRPLQEPVVPAELYDDFRNALRKLASVRRWLNADTYMMLQLNWEKSTTPKPSKPA
jgi:hypothetical protein